MLSDITVARDFQITAGFVRVPPNNPNGVNATSDIRALVKLGQTHPLASGFQLISLDSGSGRQTGGGFGGQRILRLPPVHQGAGSGPVNPDPVTVLGLTAPAQPSFPA